MTAAAHSNNFSSLHAYIKTSPHENGWTQIPWELDLNEARKKAAENKKPIFIWAMNGHPLGCT